MNKKLTVIFATMMIALCLIGISYALWSKTLTIDAYITTGDLDVVFIGYTNMDPPGPPPSLDPKNMTARWDKDVGWTTVDGIGEEEINVTLHNVYPCYFNDLEVEINNTGNIPVKIQNITITPDNFVVASGYGHNDGQLWIDWVNGVGTQLDPGDSAANGLKIHVEQCAVQEATYTFTVKICVVQWNEYIIQP
jgi:membrane-bound inhibitor of C-type lysozyme